MRNIRFIAWFLLATTFVGATDKRCDQRTPEGRWLAQPFRLSHLGPPRPCPCVLCRGRAGILISRYDIISVDSWPKWWVAARTRIISPQMSQSCRFFRMS